MFKKFRIKHEGLHRIGIILAVISIPSMFWAVEGFDENIFYTYAWVLEETFKSINLFFLSTLFHILFYLFGYFLFALIIWLIKWIKEGFK